ncbi:MAG TPA: hypothetical protein VNJ54_10490 [Plantibacter sp.]|uniref:hypothetical protein n=1 Tax=unclassified Plantibacter TaxID=2624265 RepID=UPI002CC26FC1|nr:hypothetical protein [Plantibacter sp.]
MPSTRTRGLRALLAGLAVAALCTACAPKPAVEPNAVDDARLVSLSSDPVLAGGTATEARSPDTSANVTVERGSVSLADPWPTGSPDEAAAASDTTWSTARSMLATLRDTGWEPIAVGCELEQAGSLGEAVVYATKDFGGFTAALESRVSVSDSSLVGYVPFHAEDPSPWTPSVVIGPGESCLDGDGPPSDDVPLPDDLRVERWY